MMNFRNYQFAISALSLIFAPCTQAVTGQPPVVVKAWGEHRAGNIVFHYDVSNAGARNVYGFDIGHNEPEQSDIAEGELWWKMMPISSGTGIDGEPGMDPAAVSGPVGWAAQIIQMEGSGRYLTWRQSIGASSIQSGQTFRFSVTVPSSYIDEVSGQTRYFNPTTPDNPYIDYLTGHFSAYFSGSAKPWHYDGQMELADKTPPSLAIALTPNIIRESDKPILITANLTVKDNYDPAPEIKLVSITANEPLEKEDVRALIGTDSRSFSLRAEHNEKNKLPRIYTVTYSATDASGNTSTASATVTVQREQEDKNRAEQHAAPQQHRPTGGVGALPF